MSLRTLPQFEVECPDYNAPVIVRVEVDVRINYAAREVWIEDVEAEVFHVDTGEKIIGKLTAKDWAAIYDASFKKADEADFLEEAG